MRLYGSYWGLSVKLLNSIWLLNFLSKLWFLIALELQWFIEKLHKLIIDREIKIVKEIGNREKLNGRVRNSLTLNPHFEQVDEILLSYGGFPSPFRVRKEHHIDLVLWNHQLQLHLVQLLLNYLILPPLQVVLHPLCGVFSSFYLRFYFNGGQSALVLATVIVHHCIRLNQ